MNLQLIILGVSGSYFRPQVMFNPSSQVLTVWTQIQWSLPESRYLPAKHPKASGITEMYVQFLMKLGFRKLGRLVTRGYQKL